MSEVVKKYDLPNDWEWCTLDDVADVGAGNPAPQGENKFENGDMPFVRVRDMGKLGGQLRLHDVGDHVNEKGAEGLKLFKKGSVLFTKSGASTLLNQRAILGQDSYVVSHIAIAVPKEGVMSEWVYYWMKLVDFGKLAHGANMPSLPLSKAKVIPVPLAPTEQQKRIVAKIEELFSHIDAGIEALKKAKQLLKQYRQSVLKAAVTGELTKEWRETNKNKLLDKRRLGELIEEGFKSKKKIDQNRVIKYRESDWFYDRSGNIPKEWEQVRLIDVTKLVTCGVAKRPEYVEKGIPFLSAQNSKPFSPNLKGIKQVKESDFKTFTVGGKPEKGDVLYSRVGANFGEACVIPWDFDFAIYVSLTLIKQDRSILDGRYLTIFLNSMDGLLQSRGGIMGSGIQNLNVDSVRKYRIPISSLEEQEEIVRLVDERFSAIDRLECEINNQLRKSEVNKQSILSSAFTGKIN